MNLLVDSTGIKVLSDGDWQARTHGIQGRGQWRKVNRRENSPLDCFLILLILAKDTATLDIRAVEFTPSSDGDSPVLPELLGQIPEGEVVACA